MNKYIYKLENNIITTNNETEKDTNLVVGDNRVRKVWMINIIHNVIDENQLSDYEKLKGTDKTYYIDTSTGEIIGGKEIRKEVF